MCPASGKDTTREFVKPKNHKDKNTSKLAIFSEAWTIEVFRQH
jgi:hypothetical protein